MSPKAYTSFSAAVIMQALANGYQYGFDIMDFTALPSGTVYPILSRLEKADFVRAKWESATIAHKELRPRRRYYELTISGAHELSVALEHYRSLASAATPFGLPKPSHG